MTRKSYQRAPLKGGLLNHDSRGRLKPQPLAVRESARADTLEESARQVAFFNFVRLNAPRQPLRARRVSHRDGTTSAEIVPDYDSPAYAEYLAHPLYVLTRLAHIPLGGHRDKAVAGKLKEEGARAGMLDILLDYPSRGFHGLRLEMKTAGGRVSPEQREELRWLRLAGYFAHVAYNEGEAVALLVHYLDMPHTMFRNLPTRHAFTILGERGHDGKCPDCTLKLTYPWITPKGD